MSVTNIRDYLQEWEELGSVLSSAVEEGETIKADSALDSAKAAVKELASTRILMMPPNNDTKPDYRVDAIHVEDGVAGTALLFFDSESPSGTLAILTITRNEAADLIEQLRRFLA